MNREVKQAQRWGVRSEPATHTTNVSLWSIATLIHNFSSPFLCNSLLFHHRSLSFGVLPQADLIHWRDTESAGASKMGSFKRNSLVRLPVIRLWITGMAQGPCWTGPTKSSWSHSGLKIRWNICGSTWQLNSTTWLCFPRTTTRLLLLCLQLLQALVRVPDPWCLWHLEKMQILPGYFNHSPWL